MSSSRNLQRAGSDREGERLAAQQVLLVDDHALVRAGIRSVLQREFPALRVSEAGSAAEALAALATSRPQLILLDVNLPGTNGLDLARQILGQDKRARIVMVAAEADPWAVSEAMRAGASGFVAKTNSAPVLSEAVRTVLTGGIFLCSVSRQALDRAECHSPAIQEAPGPAVLSHREQEILRYLAHGENTKAIAQMLRLSPKTVETYRARVMRKLHTDSVAALARYAVRHGLLSA